MKTARKTLTRLLAGAALAGLAITASTGAQAQSALRFSSFEPPVAYITKEILTPWAVNVTALSGGALKIDMFPGGTLGRDPAAQLKLVMDGVADMAWIVAGYTPGRFDDTTVVELPFATASVKEGSFALTRLLAQGKLAGFDGIKVLGIFATPPTEIQTTFPVTTPEDMKGKKFRAAGPTQLSMLSSLGATPVGGIAGPQVAEAMQRGMIDGALAEWNAMASFRIGEVSSHHLRVPMGAVAFMVVMNKAKFDSLPEASRALLDKNAGEAFAAFFSAKLDARNTEVAATITADAKHTVKVPDAAALAAWKAATAPTQAEWLKGDAKRPELLKAFMAEVEKVRAGQ